MQEDEVAELGLHLISGLMSLHNAGALHGDIKPSSVFLCNGPDGDVIPKLLLSELPSFSGLNSPVDSTTRQVALSTPAYLAPEAVRGRDVGPAADQYSVCAVLYECATGRPPFVAPAYSVLVAMILEVKPNAERLDGLSTPVREMILAALAKQPADRPASAEAMKAALGEGPDEMDWGIAKAAARRGTGKAR